MTETRFTTRIANMRHDALCRFNGKPEAWERHVDRVLRKHLDSTGPYEVVCEECVWLVEGRRDTLSETANMLFDTQYTCIHCQPNDDTSRTVLCSYCRARNDGLQQAADLLSSTIVPEPPRELVWFDQRDRADTYVVLESSTPLIVEEQ